MKLEEWAFNMAMWVCSIWLGLNDDDVMSDVGLTAPIFQYVDGVSDIEGCRCSQFLGNLS